MTSSCGQSAKVVVGVSTSTESLVTGSIRFQIKCTLAPGRLENTCNGPVKSSWVTFGNSTRPICSGVGVGDGADIVTSGYFGLTQNWLDDRHPDMVASCPKWHFFLISGHQPKSELQDDRRSRVSGFPVARRRRADFGIRDCGALCRGRAVDPGC